MTTNLEKRSFDLSIKKLNEKLERNISVLDMKFKDALKRIDNMRKNVIQSITDSNVVQATTDLTHRIDSKDVMNANLRAIGVSKNWSIFQYVKHLKRFITLLY